MTEKLSDRFYGNKQFKQQHFEAIAGGAQHPSVIKEAFNKLLTKYGAINPDLN
jgi:hypothetical protein